MLRRQRDDGGRTGDRDEQKRERDEEEYRRHVASDALSGAGGVLDELKPRSEAPTFFRRSSSK